MDTDTDGSLLIKRCIMDEREGLLFLQVWGGTNTIAAALRSNEDEYKDTDQWEEIYKKVCDKIQIWIGLDQDDTLNNYILPNWPDVKVIVSYNQFGTFAYWWRERVPEEYHKYLNADFMTAYIANESNPLAEIYYNNLESVAQPEEGGFMPTGEPFSFLSEGDTPNFFYIMDVGLRSWEDSSYGGWAGRFDQANPSPMGHYLSKLYSDAADGGDYAIPLYRWIDDLQNEFAARMMWCTESYENANHEPVVQLTEGIDFTAKRGDTITLTAKTYDPDGDKVRVSFWQYGDADTYGGNVDLVAGDGDQVSLVVPEDAKVGDTIQIIVEAQNDYELPITRYQRAVITVAADDAE